MPVNDPEPRFRLVDANDNIIGSVYAEADGTLKLQEGSGNNNEAVLGPDGTLSVPGVDTDSVSTEVLNNADRYVDPSDDLSSIVSEEGADSTIVLLPGTHTAEGVQIPAGGNISLIGYGNQQTVIEAPSGATDPIFVGETTPDRVRGVEIRRLKIDCKGEGVHGIDLSDFGNGISQSSIEYCRIENADRGVNGSQDDRDTFYIDHTGIFNCDVGVYIHNNHPYIENLTFRECTTGIGGDPYHLAVRDCLFERGDVGIRPLDGGEVRQSRIVDCRFTFNDVFDIEATANVAIGNCEFSAGTASIESAIRLTERSNSIVGCKFETQNESYDQLIETEGTILRNKLNDCQMQPMASKIIDYGDSVGDLRFWTITGNTFQIENSTAIEGDSSSGIFGCTISDNLFYFDGDIGSDDLIHIPDSFFGNVITNNNLNSDTTNLGYFISADVRSSIFADNRARRSDGFNALNTDSDTVERDNIVV